MKMTKPPEGPQNRWIYPAWRQCSGRLSEPYLDLPSFILTNWNATAAGDYWYGFTGSGDTPDFVRDASWAITEKTIQLPGGVNLTIKPQQTGNAGKQYSLPNIHGDTLLTTDATGTNTSTGNGPASTYTYDPYGNVLSGSTYPSNTTTSGSYAWAGAHAKLTETAFTLTPISMGSR